MKHHPLHDHLADVSPLYLAKINACPFLFDLIPTNSPARPLMVIFMSSPRALVFPIPTASGVPSKKQTQTTKETILESETTCTVAELFKNPSSSMPHDLLTTNWYVKKCKKRFHANGNNTCKTRHSWHNQTCFRATLAMMVVRPSRFHGLDRRQLLFCFL